MLLPGGGVALGEYASVEEKSSHLPVQDEEWSPENTPHLLVTIELLHREKHELRREWCKE